jgi:hypothetical protein
MGQALPCSASADEEGDDVTRVPGLRLACAFALMIGLPACGGGGSVTGGGNPTPTPVPTPTPTTTQVIFQAAFPPLDAGDGVIGDFSIPNSGAVRATMDWTFATNGMVFFIFSGTTCTEFETFFSTGAAPGCTLLGQHIAPTIKPGVINFNVTAAQNARIVVVNLGPAGESGVVQVTLTR